MTPTIQDAISILQLVAAQPPVVVPPPAPSPELKALVTAALAYAASVSQSPAPTPAPTAFRWIDTTNAKGKPGEIIDGPNNVWRVGVLPNMHWIEYAYEQNIWGWSGSNPRHYEPALPPQSNIDAIVANCMEFGQHELIVDIECYSLWPWTTDEALNAANIEKIRAVVQMVQDTAKAKSWPLKVGVYAITPIGLIEPYANPAASPAVQAQADALPHHNDLMMPIVNQADFLTLSLYPTTPDKAEYTRIAEGMAASARRITAKRTGGSIPVYAHLMETWFDAQRAPGVAINDVDMPVDLYVHAVETIRRLCDGFIAWGGYWTVPHPEDPSKEGQKAFNAIAPWLVALQAEIAKG